MMRIVEDRLALMSDRLLEAVAPRVTASAVKCVWERCCVIMGARAVSGSRLTDPLHGTSCGPCITNGGSC